MISRPEHTVLVYEGKQAEGRSAVIGDLERFPDAIAVFRLNGWDAGATGEATVSDPSGQLRKRYGLRPGEICVIRPDGYVGYIGNAAGWPAYLSSFLLVRPRHPRVTTIPHTLDGESSAVREAASSEAEFPVVKVHQAGVIAGW